MKTTWLFFLFPFVILAQQRVYQVETDETPFRELQIDQKELHVSLQFNPPEGEVVGKVQLEFETFEEPIDSLWIDAVNMNFKKILINGSGVPYKLFKRGVALKPEQPLEPKTLYALWIDYSCTPQRGVFFVGWDDETNQAPKQIWTQGQGIDHRHWIPHVDAQNDKLVTSLTVRFKSDFEVISNGELLSKSIVQGETMWRYKMDKPHSSYLIMLAIGQYDSFKESSKSGVDLFNYYYPEWEERNDFTYYNNTEVFNFLETEIGVPFPWENYKQVPVMNFQHGAMENTGATIYGDFFCVDENSFNDENYVWVNAHELAHQWFGNLVTANGSQDHWLHEGFATYFSALAVGHVFGQDAMNLTLKKEAEGVAWQEQQDFYPVGHGKAGSARFYYKGAWIVHMLRREVGDEAFHQAIKSYLNKHAFGMVTTQDLQDAFEASSGMDLDWFFEQWVYRSQIPKLNLKIVKEKRDVNVVIEQQLLENQPAYKLTIPLKIVTTSGFSSAQINMEGNTANYSFQLDAGQKLLAVIPDPNLRLLAEWTIETDVYAYLHNASVFSDVPWYWGVKALVNHPEYDAAIAKQMAKANVLVRLEYAAFLAEKINRGEILSKKELAFLKGEVNFDVIKSFLKSTTKLDEKTTAIAAKWLDLPTYEIKEKAFVLLCNSNPDEVEKYLKKLDGIYGTRGHNVRIIWLAYKIALSENVDQEFIEELANYTSPAYDFLTRMKALESWIIVKEADNEVKIEVAKNAFLAIIQNNRKLRSSAKRFIKGYGILDENRSDFQRALNQLNLERGLSSNDLTRITNMTGYAISAD